MQQLVLEIDKERTTVSNLEDRAYEGERKTPTKFKLRGLFVDLLWRYWLIYKHRD